MNCRTYKTFLKTCELLFEWVTLVSKKAFSLQVQYSSLGFNRIESTLIIYNSILKNRSFDNVWTTPKQYQMNQKV